jgi:hypothetical protein
MSDETTPTPPSDPGLAEADTPTVEPMAASKIFGPTASSLYRSLHISAPLGAHYL